MQITLLLARASWYRSLRTLVYLAVIWMFIVSGGLAQNVPPAAQVLPEAGSAVSAQKLVGTAVNSDPGFSIAVVEDRRNQRQRLLHQGQRLGDITISRIQQGYLILKVKDSEWVVRIGHDIGFGTRTTPQNRAALPTVDLVSGNGTAPQEEMAPSKVVIDYGGRNRYRVINQDEVKTALADTQDVLDRIKVTNGHLFNRTTGVRIAGFEPDSVFSRMGLRSGDLLLSVNDKEITGVKALPSFFDQLVDGGDLDLKVRRRARTYSINVLIQ